MISQLKFNFTEIKHIWIGQICPVANISSFKTQPVRPNQLTKPLKMKLGRRLRESNHGTHMSGK